MTECFCVRTDPPQHEIGTVTMLADGLWVRFPSHVRVPLGVGIVEVESGRLWRVLDVAHAQAATVVVAGPAR